MTNKNGPNNYDLNDLTTNLPVVVVHFVPNIFVLVAADEMSLSKGITQNILNNTNKVTYRCVHVCMNVCGFALNLPFKENPLTLSLCFDGHRCCLRHFTYFVAFSTFIGL